MGESRLVEQKVKEAALSTRFQEELQISFELREDSVRAKEREQLADCRAREAQKAVERSRLLERQALERAQELRTSLELLREFGDEEFMRPALTSRRSGDDESTSLLCPTTVERRESVDS